jgi:CheY-like chemotaxis protein
MTASATVPRILVVDDDEAIRDLIRRILESHHYNVLTSGDGLLRWRPRGWG